MPLYLQQSGDRSSHRLLLIVLLVISIVLCAVYAREGQTGPLHSLQSSLRSVTGEATGLTAGLGAVNDELGDALDDIAADASTLSALREQNEQLRQLLAEADEYRQEAERLQDLLDMKQVSGVTGPVGQIIGRSTSAWDQSVTINLGSSDGVRSGMTVMGATGVIGQVSSVSENSSVVRLLTDPNSGAAVMIQSSRKNGIVRGSISGVLFLEDLDDDVIPEVGDVIVTSGLGGSYESGLIVGAVASVNKTASNPTGTIVVKPNDEATVLEEVIVVFSAPDLANAQVTTASDDTSDAAAAVDTTGSDTQDAEADLVTTSE